GKSETVSFTKTKEETVDYAASQLTIRSEDDDYIDPTIIVERQPVDNLLIESAVYQTHHLIEELNVMEEVKSIGLSWDNETLHIHKQPGVEIELGTFTKEFPITQFTGEGWVDIGISPFLSDYQ